MKKNVMFSIALFITIIFISKPSDSLGAAPISEIQSSIDAIIEVLKDKNLSLPANKEKRRSTIRTLISNRFDFEEMAKRSLARHWSARTPEEKKEFISIFSELLEASYIGKIESYTDEKVTYDKEVLRGQGKYGVVSTSIVTKTVDIPIDYKVINKNNKWLVYDVVIEGVSFISTYRSQYDKIILKESYSHLVQKMKDKLKEVNSEMGAGTTPQK